MKDRIKQLRKALDLTQQEFADRIGIKRNSYANYETGRNTPIDAIIVSICREFNVNEEWLRTGSGEMFLPLDRNADIAKLTKELLNEESDSFKNRFVSMLANLSVEEWEFLEKKAKELAGMDDDT
jgi:transcriptional regulator with XRE-family HTH domain